MSEFCNDDCENCSMNEEASTEEVNKKVREMIGLPITDASFVVGEGGMIEIDGRYQLRFPVVILFERSVQ